MAVSVVMPALELAQETGKLLAWLKQEGQAVRKGEPLVEIETDKVSVELEAPGDGVLAGIRSREGDVVPVGQTIAWIVAPGEQPPAHPDSQAMAEQARPLSSAAAAPPAAAPAAARPQAGGPRISPKARRIAQERGIDLTRIRGTGPDGQITGDDVLRAAGTQAAAPQPAEPLSAVARLMAARTTESWTQAPHFFLVRHLDAGALVEAREQLGRDRFTPTDLLIAVTARVLARHPGMNAAWDGAGVHRHPRVNISVAIAVQDGVIAAVIPGADTLDLEAIAARRRDLAERARQGRLRPADVSGGTFTITNLGMYGVDAFLPILTLGQAAILAVGRIADRVVPVNGAPGIRPMITLTLSSDHRVVDGAQAAQFLAALAEALAHPRQWL